LQQPELFQYVAYRLNEKRPAGRFILLTKKEKALFFLLCGKRLKINKLILLVFLLMLSIRSASEVSGIIISNGLRAVLFCLKFERATHFLSQNYLKSVKNGASMHHSRSRLTTVMPL
jgi:hypothetical protein